MIVIATDKMYILCKKIHSVYLDEEVESFRLKSSPRAFAVSYSIKVTFQPDDSNNQISLNPSRSDDIMTVEFKIYGQKKAIQAYRDVVSQIREQCPDQVYLDKIIDRLLSKEAEDDTSADGICETRETKRRSKKILRKSKKRVR